jgi:hypothetical protein
MTDAIETPLFHVNILKKYINALIVNIKPELLPKKINLIFDSGAVNGLKGIGAALYIHHLEKTNLLRIKKISGCSIGALIAVWYSCDCPDTIYSYMDDLFSYYKKKRNFFIFEKIATNVIHQLFLNDDMSRLNGKVYINYYDTKKCKQCVVTKFKNRAHLIRCILRSAHIPFLTSTSLKYQDRYIDGIAPYIFQPDDDCKNLFIRLIHFTSPFKIINIKRERNIYSRLINGVVETNDFFINDFTSICSYVNSEMKIQLYARQCIVLFVLFLIEKVVWIKKSIPPSLIDTFYYKILTAICRAIWIHILDMMV